MNLLTDFSDYLTSLDRSPATVRGYLTDLSVFIRWLESREVGTLETLTAADIRFTVSICLTTHLPRKPSTASWLRSLLLAVGLRKPVSCRLIRP